MSLFIDKLAVTSPHFPALGRVPDDFVADGGNQPPALAISGAPAGTVEFAVICHDPDAPLAQGFTHWTVYGVPGGATVLDTDAAGVRVGPNGIGEAAWTGPQPPVGHGEHHYYFWVYALNRPVDGTPTREEFLDAYADAVIEQARLVGVYSR